MKNQVADNKKTFKPNASNQPTTTTKKKKITRQDEQS